MPDQSHKGIHGADPSRETILSGISRQTTPRSSSVPVLGEPDDATLVAGAVHGDQHAWEKIVDRYLPLVNAIARSYGLPAADREDAVQTVWLKLNQHLHTCTRPSTCGTGYVASPVTPVPANATHGSVITWSIRTCSPKPLCSTTTRRRSICARKGTRSCIVRSVD